MTFLTSVERSTHTATSFSPLSAVTNWLQRAVKQRRKRAALRALLAMDESRLSDLGIERQDIIDTLNGGPSLFARRADHARHQF